MSELLQNPIVLASLIPAIVSLVIVFWNHRHHQRMSNNNQIIRNQKEILKTLNGKKDVPACQTDMALSEAKMQEVIRDNHEDCIDFRTRIGRESQDHYKSTTKIIGALSFLVSKAGGTPADLDLG